MSADFQNNIVVLDGATTEGDGVSWDPIESLGHLKIYDRCVSEEIVHRAKGAHYLITNKCILDQRIMEQLPLLRCICLLATGFNNIDTKAARNLGIDVCNAVNYSSDSVAQHVFSLILHFTNQVSIHSQSVHQGKWSTSTDWTYRLTKLVELKGKTIGIFGYGRIGKAVARIAKGFGMKVIATRRAEITDANVEQVSWQELLSRSDVLTLHAPLSDETQNIIDANALQKMKPTSILVNTGRGGLINELDLKLALLEGRIAGAGLDVLCLEPPQADHPLTNVHNCVITPHIAWSTIEARQRLIDIVASNICAHQEGRSQNVVN